MRILSLGAGVQSSSMALMYKHGDLRPMPDAAIFSDTQAEPAAVYSWLRDLTKLLPFPVHVVTAGSLRDILLAAGNEQRFVAIPAFLVNGQADGIGRRQCTAEFKLRPIQRKARELMGLRPRQQLPKDMEPASILIGISTDEVWRAKPSKVRYLKNEHPLLDARIGRTDCLAWMTKHGYPEPPKSSCSFCPYHDNGLWRHLKDTDPAAWQDALKVDSAIRNTAGYESTQFLHPDRIPLAQVDLTSAQDRGQIDAFNNECEGMCGL